MATVNFKYHLYDQADGYERVEALRKTASEPIPLSDEELSQLIGRPFYQVDLDCTLDLTTGKVTINSATTR